MSNGSKTRTLAKTLGGKTSEGLQVPLSALYYDPAKDRRTNLGNIEELAEKIAKGYRKDRPILVQMNEEKQLFEVKDGRRRWRACKFAQEKLGMSPDTLIPITVEESKTEAEFLIQTINSNDDQAKPFEPMEEGAYFVMLTEEIKDPMSVDEIAAKIHKSNTYIRDRIALYKIDPELKSQMEPFIASGILGATAATKIAKMKDPNEQKAAWADITKAHSEAVNSQSNPSPSVPQVSEDATKTTTPTTSEKPASSSSKKAGKKNKKITVNAVTQRTKGKSDTISMKNAKANLQHCEEMLKKTDSDMYRFAIKVILAIIKNEIVK